LILCAQFSPTATFPITQRIIHILLLGLNPIRITSQELWHQSIRNTACVKTYLKIFSIYTLVIMAHGSHTKQAQLRIYNMFNDTLDLSWLNIKTLPPIPSTVKHLNCSYTNLEKLPPLPENLISLDCSYTKIRALPELPSTLSTLTCTKCKHLTLQMDHNETITDYEKRWVIWRGSNNTL